MKFPLFTISHGKRTGRSARSKNPACISYIDDVGSRNYMTVDARMGIMKQIDHDAELVVLLSAIQDNLRMFSMIVSHTLTSTCCFVDIYTTHPQKT